ncbi:MAG TPA: hypothetical protein PKH07_17750, partial [bacterium]|nr:hypothetical protein [bacterium]
GATEHSLNFQRTEFMLVLIQDLRCSGRGIGQTKGTNRFSAQHLKLPGMWAERLPSVEEI